MNVECNRDCFNCIYDDCILKSHIIFPDERKEITNRDNSNSYYGTTSIISGNSTKLRKDTIR